MYNKATHMLVFAVGLCLPHYCIGAVESATLDKLASMTGKTYQRARDETLAKSVPAQPQNYVSDKPWDVNLVSLLIGERLRHSIPDWTEEARSRTVSGQMHIDALDGLNQLLAAPLLVEIAWKSEIHELRAAACRELVDGKYREVLIPGDTRLWRAVWDGTNNVFLRRIAVHSMAQHPQDAPSLDLVSKLLDDVSVAGDIKLAALTAIVDQPDAWAAAITSVAAAKGNGQRVRRYAIWGISFCSSSKPHDVLRVIASDPQDLAAVRAMAVSAFKSQPRNSDVPIVMSMLDLEAAPELQRAAASVFATYEDHPELAQRALVLIQRCEDRIVASTAAGMLARSSDPAMLDKLQSLADDPATSDRRSKLIQTIVNSRIEHLANWRPSQESKNRGEAIP